LDYSFPILIAEDNPVSRKLLEKTLLKAGYDVSSVENGKRALSLFKERFFPIVLTDWIMPEMDGLELCRAIRGSEVAAGYVYLILLTARDSKDDIIAGLEAGADDYLTKPFNRAELMARLNTGMRILELERSLKKANEDIRMLSITDPLTGSYNRGYLSERFPKETKRALRYGRPLSVILADIDHFKQVNDTYGHLVGDLILKTFVKRLKENLRQEVDWVVRYGGEEFLIILPETDVEGARVVAERMRKKICAEGAEVDGIQVSISASFGITGFSSFGQEEDISMESIIGKADEYLYQAKREGRNRVRGEALQSASAAPLPFLPPLPSEADLRGAKGPGE
jgi:two-component system, cell cycle response regulator